MSTQTHTAMRMYERYGGMMQGSPLTEEEQKYDATCRSIDELEQKIGETPLSHFIAHEFMWFSHHVTKLYMFPKQPALDRQLEDLTKLYEQLLDRAANAEGRS